jgi:methylthioribose-1-phosphate isomerase
VCYTSLGSTPALQDMVVRGAPAIGCTGVLTLAMDVVANRGAGAAFKDAADAHAYITRTADYLVTRCVAMCCVVRALGRK